MYLYFVLWLYYVTLLIADVNKVLTNAAEYIGSNEWSFIIMNEICRNVEFSVEDLDKLAHGIDFTKNKDARNYC